MQQVSHTSARARTHTQAGTHSHRHTIKKRKKKRRKVNKRKENERNKERKKERKKRDREQLLVYEQLDIPVCVTLADSNDNIVAISYAVVHQRSVKHINAQ